MTNAEMGRGADPVSAIAVKDAAIRSVKCYPLLMNDGQRNHRPIMTGHFDFLRHEFLESGIDHIRVEDAFRERLLLCIEIINRNRRSPRRDINQAMVGFPIRTTATEGSGRRQLDFLSLPRG